MKLAIAERLILFTSLPSEGSFETLRLIRELRETLGLSEQENAEVNFRTEENQWRWDHNIDKEVELSSGAVKVLKDALKQIGELEKAQPLHLEIYERLCKEFPSDE